MRILAVMLAATAVVVTALVLELSTGPSDLPPTSRVETVVVAVPMVVTSTPSPTPTSTLWQQTAVAWNKTASADLYRRKTATGEADR